VFVTGLVLAAGGSRRLGRPKQLLPYAGATLLEATMRLAGRCGFDQLLVTLGADSAPITARVDLGDAGVVQNPQYAGGCGSSISVAMQAVDPRADGVVLLLGDQPEIQVEVVDRLVTDAVRSPIGVCRYTDGLGHPFWFRRDLFAELGGLHGDKAVWKLLHSERFDVREVPVDTAVPIDVDTWADYQALVSRAAEVTG
jgi:molybdenum cofactor cytidylyltransferase